MSIKKVEHYLTDSYDDCVTAERLVRILDKFDIVSADDTAEEIRECRRESFCDDCTAYVDDCDCGARRGRDYDYDYNIYDDDVSFEND